MTKICTKCKEKKSVTLFAVASKNKSGLQSCCKSCNQAYRKGNADKIKSDMKAYHLKNKESLNIKRKAYYQDNKVEIAAKSRVFYMENHDRIRAEAAEFYLHNKPTILARNKAYRADNFEQLKAQKTSYVAANKELVAARKRDYVARNKDKVSAARRNYYGNNKEKLAKAKAVWHKQRVIDDPVYAVKRRIRCLIWQSLSGYRKTKKTEEIIGCCFAELHKHLETYPTVVGASAIDHFIPLALAKNSPEVLALNHYTNLRLISKADNLAKGAKVPSLEEVHEFFRKFPDSPAYRFYLAL